MVKCNVPGCKTVPSSYDINLISRKIIFARESKIIATRESERPESDYITKEEDEKKGMKKMKDTNTSIIVRLEQEEISFARESKIIAARKSERAERHYITKGRRRKKR